MASEGPTVIAVTEQLKFSSEQGQAIVREILGKALKFEPHDYQIEGVCKSLDGVDLLAVVPTGGGKTGFFFMYVLVIQALAQDENLRTRFARRFPADAAMIIIFPTNGLEEEMVQTFASFNLTAIAINSHTIDEAYKRGENLWLKARTGIPLVLLSPEQLVNKGFESLLRHQAFANRVCTLAIDEVHLLNSWGQSFRKSFQQIGFMRMRMEIGTNIIAVTATLMAGNPTANVLESLGLNEGRYHLIRRSNYRPDLALIFRTLSRGLGGWLFPDLDTVLTSNRKTVISCRTISLSFRVMQYLYSKSPSSTSPRTRIRWYNSLASASYSERSRQLFRTSETQILVATATFMVGMDYPDVQDVILLGHTATVDELLQWGGRAGRDWTVVQGARCITYVTKKAPQIAQDILDGKQQRTSKSGTSTGVEMDAAMASLIVAPCKVARQNELYNNPTNDTPCSCSSCRHRCASITQNTRCSCSGPDCSPEVLPPIPQASRKPLKPNPISRRLRLTRYMRTHGEAHFHKLREGFCNSADTAASRFLPPHRFLPDSIVKAILDTFALLRTADDIRLLVQDEKYAQQYVSELFQAVQMLRIEFEQLRDQQKRKRNAALFRQADSESGSDFESEDDTEVPDGVPQSMLSVFSVTPSTLQTVTNSPSKRQSKRVRTTDRTEPPSPSKRPRTRSRVAKENK